MEKKMTAAICALAMLALTACGASVTEITLPESIELAPGESQQVEIAYTYDKEGLGEQAQQRPLPLQPSAGAWREARYPCPTAARWKRWRAARPP